MELFVEQVKSDSNIPQITRLQTVAINKNQVLIQWAVSDNIGSNYNINDYEFYLQRSFSDTDEFDELTEALEGITEYLDEPQTLARRWSRIFYKLRVKHKNSGEEQLFGPVSIHENSASPSQHMIAAIQRHNMYLERLPVGSLSFSFIQRQWGQRCSCWSPIRGRSDDSSCLMCAGTGWYYPYSSIPIKSYIALNPDIELIKQMDFEVEADEKHAWASNYPDFKKRDIIIVPGKNNSIYRVSNKRWLGQERNEIGVVQGIHLVPLEWDEPEKNILNVSIDEIKDYMEVIWGNSKKTYFGCRTGLPSKEIKRDHGKTYYEPL
jgi:hypothetical protein